MQLDIINNNSLYSSVVWSKSLPWVKVVNNKNSNSFYIIFPKCVTKDRFFDAIAVITRDTHIETEFVKIHTNPSNIEHLTHLSVQRFNDIRELHKYLVDISISITRTYQIK